MVHNAADEPGTNVLVLSPARSSHDEAACGALLDVESSEDVEFLSITIVESIRERFEIWEQHVSEDPPAYFAGVSAADMLRGAAAERSSPFGPTSTMPSSLEIVSDVSNLTKFGVAFTVALSDCNPDERQLVVCFHSITALLQYVDEAAAFRFLHAMTTELTAVNAISHFHADPNVLDEQSRSRFYSLFDTVITHSPEHDCGFDHETSGPSH